MVYAFYELSTFFFICNLNLDVWGCEVGLCLKLQASASLILGLLSIIIYQIEGFFFKKNNLNSRS